MAEQKNGLISPSTKPRSPSSFAVVAIAAAVVIVLALAGGVLLLVRRPRPAAVLSPEMKRDFGAAAYVPQDVSVYTSHLHLGDSWRSVWRSKAVQGLVALPAVQRAWRQAQRLPAYKGFEKAAKSEPPSPRRSSPAPAATCRAFSRQWARCSAHCSSRASRTS